MKTCPNVGPADGGVTVMAAVPLCPSLVAVIVAEPATITVTDATGTCTTVMADVPLCPSLVAVIVAEPATLPVTSPLELTVATDVLELAHVTTRPDNGLPLPSWGVAVSCTVLPSFTEADAGVTVTEATGTAV